MVWGWQRCRVAAGACGVRPISLLKFELNINVFITTDKRQSNNHFAIFAARNYNVNHLYFEHNQIGSV